MRVRIYKPNKSVTQSGRAGTGQWILEYETETRREPGFLMGWTTSGDTLNQVRLKFDTKDDAVAFAKKEGWDYSVSKAHERRVLPRNYTDNFKYVPVEE